MFRWALTTFVKGMNIRLRKTIQKCQIFIETPGIWIKQ